MEPEIRYTRTVDGLNIAYTRLGSGPPILLCRTYGIGLETTLEMRWPFLTKLASGSTVTIFDYAGIGASQRAVTDFSLDSQSRCIEAVADCIDAEGFTLIGHVTGVASAALYASRHPEHVVRLGCVGFVSAITGPAFAGYIRSDWRVARRLWAGGTFPDGPIAMQKWYSGALKESMTPEVAAGYYEELARTDLASVFAGIHVPTLLVAPRRAEDERDVVRSLAAAMPDCRVALTERGAAPGESEASACLGFMGVSPSGATRNGPAGTAVILFTDIADSTALTERMGDVAFRDASRALDAGLRTAIRDAGGAAIDGKLLGDGVLATFPSAAQAVDAARRCHALSAASALRLHLGIHAGDVIREQDNVYGGAVNIASRICGLSAPGEILVSDVVRGMARSSAGVEFDDRGEQEMKGVGEPVRVYEVRWQP